MTEANREAQPELDALSDVERGSRIEQLLVSGLDEYFAGRLEQAVNVWTRVLFLDRTNDRARAYIDRARRAQGERQRETEALVHQGLQAFDAGDVEQARRLLTSALDEGASHEQALPVLHRIGLLAAPVPVRPQARRSRWRRPDAVVPASPRRWWLGMIAASLLLMSATGLWIVVAGADGQRAMISPAIDPPAGPLPVPAPSEAFLVRANTLFAAGRLRDALTALDRITAADGTYGAAQALRVRVQQELLRTAALGQGDGVERSRP